ncbi:MAG: DNA circularization N-terminal domain-containing protein [Oscillospiraceae bacterium]|nr:DNA circularization N-terminal domain-containing protein [Oscillospiraceae bacterium]
MTGLYMGYRNFTWPRLPDTLRMENQKYTQVLQQPENGETLQDLGKQGRVVSGSGTFLGEMAARQWKELCMCYEQAGTGMLYLPGRKPMEAAFTELQLQGTPRADRIAYCFTFREIQSAKEADNTLYRAGTNECLWSAAAAAGVSPDCLLAANPGVIRWANELPEGMELKLS